MTWLLGVWVCACVYARIICVFNRKVQGSAAAPTQATSIWQELPESLGKMSMGEGMGFWCPAQPGGQGSWALASVDEGPRPLFPRTHLPSLGQGRAHQPCD